MKLPFALALTLAILISCLFDAGAAEPKGARQKMKNPPWLSYNVIDVHAHIGTFTGYDLSLDTLLKSMSSYGVRMALISNIDGAHISATKNLSEKEANDETARVVRLHSKSLRGLAWTRPEDGSADHLTPFLNMHLDNRKAPLFVGMKFHPEFNRFTADDRKVDPYLSLCEKHKLSAVFHCGDSQSNSGPEHIYALARRHPTVPVVLYHMGFNTNHGDAIKVVKESIDRNDAQLYLETAQSDPHVVLDAIKLVGADRVLFGTDATYYGKGHYDHYKDMIDLLHQKLSPADFKKVVHDNAVRLFGV